MIIIHEYLLNIFLFLYKLTLYDIEITCNWINNIKISQLSSCTLSAIRNTWRNWTLPASRGDPNNSIKFHSDCANSFGLKAIM